jgi:hypothetical protein
MTFVETDRYMAETPTFTPAQIAIILLFSQPILLDDRPAYFDLVVASLTGAEEVGDETVFRACCHAQAPFRSLGDGVDG